VLAWRQPRNLSSRLEVIPPAMGRQLLNRDLWLPSWVMSSPSTVCSSRVRSHPLIITVVTNGNHTATQSTFDNPCIPAHETNTSINGFDSGFRYTEPGTAGTILSVPIIEQNANQTFWFYDYNTCGEGGVGVINGNESSSQTLAGFTVCDFCSLDIFAILAPQLNSRHFTFLTFIFLV
jgi:hypothetical protein